MQRELVCYDFGCKAKNSVPYLIKICHVKTYYMFIIIMFVSLRCQFCHDTVFWPSTPSIEDILHHLVPLNICNWKPDIRFNLILRQY